MHDLLERINEWQYALYQLVEVQLQAGSLSAVFGVFAAGVLTSFTPCVYPMIPVTVTFIGGAAAGNRRRAVTLSLVYVLGLASIYAALGVTAALLGKTFGKLTHLWWIYAAVGSILIVFGISMLGWINIPVLGMATKIQAKGAKRGGLLGALFVGLASGFVAAPCTAPVLGALLVYVAGAGSDGSVLSVVWGGTLLLVFGLGLGLLLMVLGIFSGLLSNLPPPGPWMNVVKIVFGVAIGLVGIGFLIFAGGILFSW
jgi:thiol:disulfide interchange protein DsbD